MSDAPSAKPQVAVPAPAPASAPQPPAGGPPHVPVAPPVPGPGQRVTAAPGWELGPNGWQPVKYDARQAREAQAMRRAAMPPTLFQRFWPGPGRVPAPRVSLSLIVVAAVVAAISLVLSTPGFGWLLTALALAAAAVFTGLVRKADPGPATVVTPPAFVPAQQPSVPAQRASVTAPPAPAAPETSAEQEPAVAAVDAPVVETTADDAAEIVATVVTDASEAGDSTVVDESTVDETTVDNAAPEAAGSSPRRLSLGVHGERIFWGLCALALVSVGTFRAAGWLFFWCVVFAFGCSALALGGGRTVQAMFLSLVAFPSSIFRSPPWIVRGLAAMRSRGGGPRLVISIAISVLLVVVFGGLFAGADAEFAHVLGKLVPPLKASEVARAIFCFIVVAAVACGVAFLAAARPQLAALAPSKPRRVRRVEWVLPLAVLNALFAVFVYIQLTVLFGNNSELLNASHKYMRGYAHSGFWQLLVVTLLTLTVLGIAGRVAPRETRSDRTLLRLLLGGLTVFSIVVVLSALKRVDKYEHAYGFTRLRVVVAGVEVWFGVLFVLVLIAGIGLKTSWLPRVIVASLALSLLAGAIANPDRYVAQQNVDRYQQTGKLSIEYMRQMSPDAVPAIEKLPPSLRDCSLVNIAQHLADRGDDWRTWNFSRVDARNQIGLFVIPARSKCPGLVR